MKNAEALRRRLDEIEKMTSYTEALVALSTITFDIGMDAYEERTIIRRDVERIRKIIEGNGDHTHSVVYRLACVETSLAEVAESVAKVAKNVQAITDKLIGSLEEEGYIAKSESRFKTLEETRTTINRVVWIVAGVVITQITVAAIVVLSKVIGG